MAAWGLPRVWERKIKCCALQNLQIVWQSYHVHFLAVTFLFFIKLRHLGHHHLLLFQFFLPFRGMKIEKEIFPAGTDSRYFREVGMQLFYNLPMIYLGGFCLEVLPRIFLVRFLNIFIMLSTCLLQSFT